MLVLDCARYKAFAGGSVTVYGGIFKATYKIKIGTATQSPTDVGDGFIVFSAPSDVGEYAFSIMDSSTVLASAVVVVTAMANASVYRLPVRTEDNYTNMLTGMMPRGFIFNLAKGSNFNKLFKGIAAGFKFVYDMFRALVLEGSPITTTSLDEFENELGLPREGLLLTNSEARKKEIYRVSRQQNGCTIPHYQQLMEAYGKDCVFYEYWKNSSVFPDWVSNTYGDEAVFCVLVKVYQDKFGTIFNCKSKCNKSLGNERDLVLEKLLNHEKPAHVKFIYEYAIRVLTDENEYPLLDDQDRMLIV